MTFKTAILSAIQIIASSALLPSYSSAQDEVSKEKKAVYKELDLSGFSKLNSTSHANMKFKATCTSRYSGSYKEGEKGFEACMSEFEQAKFKETTKDPQNYNPHNNSPSMQFSTDENLK